MCHSQAERVTCHVSRVTCHVSPDTQHTCDTLSRHSFCVCSAVSPLSVTLTRHPQTSSEPTSSCYNSADSYSSQTMNNHQQVLIRLCELAQRAQREFCMHTHRLITDCCLLLIFISPTSDGLPVLDVLHVRPELAAAGPLLHQLRHHADHALAPQQRRRTGKLSIIIVVAL